MHEPFCLRVRRALGVVVAFAVFAHLGASIDRADTLVSRDPRAPTSAYVPPCEPPPGGELPSCPLALR